MTNSNGQVGRDLTATPQQPPLAASSDRSRLAVEVAKALALVAPVTMSHDQQTAWLASAVDALDGIRPGEVEAVSLELRRTVTRPAQIVPEISRLVAAHRAKRSRAAEQQHAALPSEPRRKVPVMDRRGQPMSAEDTDELNRILASLGATARYRTDGSRYKIDSEA